MPRAICGFILGAAFWTSFVGTARGLSEPIVFEARPPTEHSETCPVCRFGPPEPFWGSFVATLTNVGDAFEEYSLSEVHLYPPASRFGFGGTGTPVRRIGVLPAVEMTLDLISPDYLAPPGRIQLHGQSEETSADWWPVVRLTLSGTTENAYTHTIRLSAAPRAEYRWYQMKEGSQ